MTTRAEFVAKIPSWYSGWAHFAVVNLATLAIIGTCVMAVHGARWYEWALAPGFFVFANFFEWWVHRGPMHHRRPGARLLFERHTLTHHAFFHPENMAYGSSKELVYVLFPAWVVPMFLLLVSPFVILLGIYVSQNLALIFLASVFAYYLVYEWFHTMHHIPGSRTGSHHRRHHDPKRMTTGNFNVSFPLADWVLGTLLDEQPPR
jgi:hypothetical protein